MSDYSESGFEQRGPLLSLVNRLLVGSVYPDSATTRRASSPRADTGAGSNFRSAYLGSSTDPWSMMPALKMRPSL
ncbi:MAG: hypothetical protein R3A10_19525 [Caldilineaceae bacterium]